MTTPSIMHLTISSVSEQLFNGEVLSVTAPGVEGEMTIMAHHESIITILKIGKIKVREAQVDDPKLFDIQGGVLEASNNQVTILV